MHLNLEMIHFHKCSDDSQAKKTPHVLLCQLSKPFLLAALGLCLKIHDFNSTTLSALDHLRIIEHSICAAIS